MGEFANRLRAIRKEAALSQAALAEKSGFTRGGIAQLETGAREPSWSTVLALAAALGVDANAFQQPPATTAKKKPAPGKKPKKK